MCEFNRLINDDDVFLTPFHQIHTFNVNLSPFYVCGRMMNVQNLFKEARF